MNDHDDPYQVLGVTRDATPAQIKAAYRKAALRHHPDKVPPQDKETATLRFSKIANAYELLSDDQKRAAYEASTQPYHNNHGFAQPPQQQPYHNAPNYHFHDPFEVFRHVFREEFGGQSPFTSMHSTGDPFANMMNDPFFSNGFSSSPFGSMHGDPFFSGSMGSMSRPSSSLRNGNRGGGSLFDQFDSMFDDLQQQQSSSKPYSYSYSSTSSSTTTNQNGETVTTHTSRRVVNGQEEEAVTERIVRKADGSVERQVLNNPNNTAQRLEESPQSVQQQQQSSVFPWKRRSSRSSSRDHP